MEKWLQYVKSHKSEATYKQYSRIVMGCKNALGSTEAIEGYILSIAGKLSNNTANLHLAAIKSFCKWRSQRYNTSNPAQAVDSLPPEPSKRRVLSPAEYTAVLQACRTSAERNMILVLGNTGLRASEYLAVRPEHITSDKRFLVVVGKRQKKRYIPLNHITRAILADSKPYRPRYKSRQGIHYKLQCLARRAKIQPFSAHSLRHYFATELFRRGVDAVKISKLLGHSSINTTLNVYVHFAAEDLAGLCDVLE